MTQCSRTLACTVQQKNGELSFENVRMASVIQKQTATDMQAGCQEKRLTGSQAAEHSHVDADGQGAQVRRCSGCLPQVQVEPTAAPPGRPLARSCLVHGL